MGNEVDWDYPVSDKQRGPSLSLEWAPPLLSSFILPPTKTFTHIHTL